MNKFIATSAFFLLTNILLAQNWAQQVLNGSEKQRNVRQRATPIADNIKITQNPDGNNINLINTNKFIINVDFGNDNVGRGNLSSNVQLRNNVSQSDLNIGRNYINNGFNQSQSNPIIQPQIQTRGNSVPTNVNRSRGNDINEPIQRTVVQINVNRGSTNPVRNIEIQRQVLNEDINFSNTRNIEVERNTKLNFEVNLVQRKEAVAIPNPSLDLSLNLNVKAPKINLELPKIKLGLGSKETKTSVSSKKRKSEKHAYYSQDNKNYTGKKIKNWLRKNFKTKRKIRISVACPSF